jgi:hypothetical protein
MPSRLIFYDCETIEQQLTPTVSKHKLRLGVACAVTRYASGDRQREKWITFKTPEQFWKFVLRYTHKKTKTYLIAHNQHFDFPAVDGFRKLAEAGYSQSLPILDSNLFIISYRAADRSIVVLDSLNYFKFSIEYLGKTLGLPKGKIDFKTCSEADLKAYCKRDVEILKKTFLTWISFLLTNDLGNFKYTVASQAFNAYRHRFMNVPLYIHAHKSATHLERMSYRGGRVEAYYIGDHFGDIHVYDFNSLYPYIMRKESVPTKLVKFSNSVALNRLLDLIDDYCIIANVDIAIEKAAIGIKRERLIFPVGSFNCTLTTPELQWDCPL